MLHRRFAPRERGDALAATAAADPGRARRSTGASRTCAASTRIPSPAPSKGQTPETATGPMLDLDVAGLARREGESSRRAPDGITFEPLAEHHPRLHELVGGTRSSLRTTPPSGSTACSSTCPGRRPGAAALRAARERGPKGTLFWRLLVIAREGARASLIEEYASSHPELEGYSNAAVEIFVGEGAKLEYVSLQNLSQATWHFATHHARVERDAELDWIAGGFGSHRGQDVDPERPRRPGRHLARDGRVLHGRHQHLDYDTYQLHIAPNTTSDFAFKGALRDIDGGLARDDPRRAGRAEDERVPGEPRPDAVADDARGADPGARDPRERRALHARRDGRPRRPRRALLLHGARTLACRGRAAHRARVLQDILDRIELEPVREALASALDARIPEA